MRFKGENMSKDTVDQFQKGRQKLNDLVMQLASKNIKRFYALDNQVYSEGALPARTKELLGLVASLVLRCDDCIKYHLSQCYQYEISDAELEEVLAVGLIVGGSIVIPHLRRAVQFWDDLQAK